jgi:hypothetical protein
MPATAPWQTLSISKFSGETVTWLTREHLVTDVRPEIAAGSGKESAQGGAKYGISLDPSTTAPSRLRFHSDPIDLRARKPHLLASREMPHMFYNILVFLGVADKKYAAWAGASLEQKQ